MKKTISAHRLSSKEKLKIIRGVKAGISVSESCRSAGISRSIYYKWIREYSSIDDKKSYLALKAKYPKGEAHWRRINNDTRKNVLIAASKYPHYSIRAIAAKTGISPSSAWNIIGARKRNFEANRNKQLWVKSKFKKLNINKENKLLMIFRFINGDSVSSICRDFNVSRTIFYRWLKEYKKNKGMFDARRPSRSEHWHYKPGIEEFVLETASVHPEYSLNRVHELVTNDKKINISRSGLYYIMRRLNLNTYRLRTAYAQLEMEKSNQISQVLTYNLPEKPRYSFISYLAPPFLFLRNYSVFVVVIILFTTMSIVITTIILFKYPHTGDINIFKNNRPSNKVVILPNFNKAKTLQNIRYELKEPADQDFRWGVMSMNSQKSVYKTGERVRLGFGVLNNKGLTLCNASLALEIMSPSSTKQILDSKSGGVIGNANCANKNVGNDFDYSAEFVATEAGVYDFLLTAKTGSGMKQIKDRIAVKDKQPFIVERSGFPTRVYPYDEYPVYMTIKPTEDFKGEINETIPSNMEIINTQATVRDSGRKLKILSWNVDWKKSNTYILAYTVKFPEKSPDFYYIRPLTIYQDKDLVFEEERVWQIAIDIVSHIK